MVNLWRLNLEANRLAALPAAFPNLSALKELNLSRNALRHLPATFRDLTKLVTLKIWDNPIQALPEGFEDLKLYCAHYDMTLRRWVYSPEFIPRQDRGENNLL